MPQLGETVTEGTITKWMKAVGDEVARDEPLFEVSTDKVDSEVPSPAAGVLSEIIVPEGETVEVGVRLAVIGDGSGASGSSDAPAAAAAEAPAPAPAAEAAPPAAPPPPPAPHAAQAALRPRRLRPPQHLCRHQAAEPAPQAGAERQRHRCRARQVLSPMVRRILSENDIDESEVTGTGAGGRITRDDALRAADDAPIGRRHRAAPTRGADAGSGGAGGSRRATGPGRAGRPRGLDGAVPHRRRPDRAVLQHAPAYGRAHGAVQGDLAARVHRQRGRLRGRRARARRRGANASRRKRASPSPTSPSWRGRPSRRCATSRC